MLSDLAMPVGLTGTISSVPLCSAVAIGLQPGGLRAEDRPLRRRRLDQPDLDQLAERLVHLGQQLAAGHRDHHLRRDPPAELLGDLVPEGLGALGVERPDVDVDERGVLELVGLGQLRAQPVDVVVGAVDRDHVAAVDGGRDDLAGLQVGRDEHDRRHAGPRGVRGDRVGQVAGGGAAIPGEAERLAPRSAPPRRPGP